MFAVINLLFFYLYSQERNISGFRCATNPTICDPQRENVA